MSQIQRGSDSAQQLYSLSLLCIRYHSDKISRLYPPVPADLLSASVEKLEPLPVEIGGESPGESADQSWIEETEEKAQRGV